MEAIGSSRATSGHDWSQNGYGVLLLLFVKGVARVYPRQQDDACTQSLRLIELITCVMSSYPWSESSYTPPSSSKPPRRLPEHRSCGTPELLALAAPRRLSLPNDGHTDSSQELHRYRGIAGLLHRLHCTYTSPLHNRNVPHSEDETVASPPPPPQPSPPQSSRRNNRRKAAYAADKASPASSSPLSSDSRIGAILMRAQLG